MRGELPGEAVGEVAFPPDVDSTVLWSDDAIVPSAAFAAARL